MKTREFSKVAVVGAAAVAASTSSAISGRFPRFIPTALALASVLAIAACGGGGSSDPAAQPETLSVAAAAEQPDTLSLAAQAFRASTLDATSDWCLKHPDSSRCPA